MGGFDAKYGIKLCANYLETKSQLEDTMAHEMVHAYDHLRFKVDWDAEDLTHVACTEVSMGGCDGLDWELTNRIDSSKQFERRMQMGERILQEQDIQVRQPTPGLRKEEGGLVSKGETAVQ